MRPSSASSPRIWRSVFSTAQSLDRSVSPGCPGRNVRGAVPVRPTYTPGVNSRLMLLDTASLYFRAFFGVPDSVVAPNGMPVNAVRGLLEFINRLVDEYRPTHLACCWDNDWRPQWRVDLLPSYKAHRVEAPR